MTQLLVGLAFVPRSMGILASLEREQPDVVHLFWGHYPSIVGFLVLARLPRTVLSMFLGTYDLTRLYRGSAWVASRADLVSTHARWNVPVLEALGAPQQRIHVAYRESIQRYSAESRHQKHGGGLFPAGVSMKERGWTMCCSCFEKSTRAVPRATLRLLGQGPERANLERLSQSLGIDRAVTFVGHVAQRRVARELAAAEVFLHMSWDETERLPNVVKEAMASRCLCVVTRTSGIRGACARRTARLRGVGAGCEHRGGPDRSCLRRPGRFAIRAGCGV